VYVKILKNAYNFNIFVASIKIMDLIWLYKRLKLILVNPSMAWQKLKDDSIDTSKAFKNYILPLILLIIISNFLSAYLFDLSFIYAVISTIIFLIALFLSIRVSIILLTRMIKNLNITITQSEVSKIIFFSLTPFLLALIFVVFNPSLSFILIFGLYSIYIFYIGVPVIIDNSEDNRITFTIAATVIFIVVFFSTKWILFKIYANF